ncbi:C2 domain protein [Onchocerca flexuosa]|uniref:C2 domain protein n=1 Tax=Onchocerca flexuosa TaxID=387005 RepID=A0A238BRT3_9BILA|nr:C2 domain protein [Onchocerca flexuosa]
MNDPYGVFINSHSTLSLNRFNERKRGRHERRQDEILMNLSSESEDEFYNCHKDMAMESVSDITSDSDFCQPIPVARGANRNWINKPAMIRTRRSQVPCGIGARARTRHGSLPMIMPIDHSSSYETETTNEDDDSEFCDRRHRSPPPSLLRGLSMIEIKTNDIFQELSPINDTSDDIPKVPSLQLTRNWHPLATSTTTSIGLPKTNPHHLKTISTSTPATSISSIGRCRSSVLSAYNNIMYDTLERPASFFEGQTPRKDWGRPQSEILSSGCLSNINWKPDHFGLPTPFARRIGCKGKLELTMSISGCFLTVSVVRAIYFLDPAIAQASSYVRIEIRPNPLYNKRMRSCSEDRFSHNDQEKSFRTRLVLLSNRPQFHENFTFELRRNHYRHHDLLSVSVWITNAGNSARKQMLGCMASPIRRLIRKANLMVRF